MAKVRLDDLLISRGYADSTQHALALVLAGNVLVDDERMSHVGATVRDDSELRVTTGRRFVSRGGEKLDAALDAFKIGVEGKRAIDVGASTGGFTDVLLKRGANSVTALDVGYGQLDWSLQSDDRVTVLDRTNIKDVDAAALGAPFDVVVADVSFIPISVIAKKLVGLASEDGDIVALVKPQFELERAAVGEKGVVRDAKAHIRAVERAIVAFTDVGSIPVSIGFSPITGPEGNIEFLLHVRRRGDYAPLDIEPIVEAAHRELGV